MTIEKVLRDIQFWLEKDGIEGIAQGEIDNEVCITVFVSFPGAEKALPSTYKGYKVVIELTDEFNPRGL